MDPFAIPPATPPVSLDPPLPGDSEPPRRRGRMALVALAAAGLVGGGMVGISQLVSADRPEVVSSDRSLTAVDAPDDEAGEDDADDEAPEPIDDSDGPVVEGEIVIDTGDGEPIVIELDGDLDAAFEEFQECVGLPVFGDGRLFDLDDRFPLEEWDESKIEEFLDGLPLDELDGGLLGGFGEFELGGTHVTVAGPDGVQVIDLGDGDGSVTITKQGDEVTITTDGDATVEDLPDLFEVGPLGGQFEEMFGDDPDLVLGEILGEDFEAMFDEFFEDFGAGFDLGDDLDFGEDFEFGELAPLAELQECLDALHDD